MNAWMQPSSQLVLNYTSSSSFYKISEQSKSMNNHHLLSATADENAGAVNGGAAGARMDVDNQHAALWPNENDVDEQMHTLMNEPFVLRIQDFFNLTLEKIKNDHDKRNEFLSLCRTFDKAIDSSYEDSLKKIFDLVCAYEPLDQIFVELLPEKFTQRIFPQIEANIVQRFDHDVKAQVSVDEYHRYIQCVLDFYHTGGISQQQFKEQMAQVLSGYPSLLEQLPIFFSEIGESPAPSQQQIANGAQSVADQQQFQQQLPQNANQVPNSHQIEKQQMTAGNAGGPVKQSEAAQAVTATVKGEKASQKNTGKPGAQQAATDNASQAQTSGQQPGTITNQIGGAASQRMQQMSQAVIATNPAQSIRPPQPKLPTPIPERLQRYPKVDVGFFLDRMPDLLKDRSLTNDFMNLFTLYLDGVLTSTEFFDLAQDLMTEQNDPDRFGQLQTMVSQRDNSRRDYLEIGQQKFVQMLSKSYGVFSDEYVAPICSGRYAPGERSLWVLNDRYSIKTSGTEDYKFKIKNIHEDNLFKNEDEMYAIDHQILQITRVISKLSQEAAEAKKWSEQQQNDEFEPGKKSSDYEPRFLTEQHYSFIKRFYEEVMPDQPSLTIKRINSTIRKMPVVLIETWVARMENHLGELSQDKADKLAEWKQLCESNFVKSLDHRSFFFKKEQKELLPAKKQQLELERIQNTPLSRKSVNQLKGGSSPEHEFYCTYTSFKINHIQVYTQQDLQAPSLVNDYPINLRDPELIKRNPGALPQMRFLLNDRKMLELTFMVLICGPRVGCNITVAEKCKIEDIMEIYIGQYFRCEHSFKQLKAASKQIGLLQEEEIALLTKNSIDYYRAKAKDGFKFQTWGSQSSGTANEAEENNGGNAPTSILNNPQTLQLPFLKEDSAHDCDSNVNGNKGANNANAAPSQCSQNSSSDSASVNNRPPSAADLKQLINLHIDSQKTDQVKEQGLLEPAFKEGYSLLFGTMPVYLVFKMIASIYERLVKAQQLIRAKVDQDLEKSEILEVIGLTDPAQIEDYKKQACVERFKLFINALVGTLSQTPQKKLDPSNYEDIVRMLMGDQAYLLFVFDKLIMQTLKNLPTLKANDECQKNLQLFVKFSKEQSGRPQNHQLGSNDAPIQQQQKMTNNNIQVNEHLYLTQFQQQMQSVNNFNGTCIRLLYSPISGVLCLHVFNLSPFGGLSGGGGGGAHNHHQGTQTLASFKPLDQHKQKLLRQNMYCRQNYTNKNINENSHEKPVAGLHSNNATPQQTPSQAAPAQINFANQSSSVEDIENLRVPVFLNRNRRKMKELRKHLWQKSQKIVDGELQVENGLVMRQVPQIRKLVYDPHSTDFMVYKRRRVTEDGQNAEEIEAKRALQDYKAVQRMQKVLEAQKERLFKQFASSDEGVDQQSPSSSQNNLEMALQSKPEEQKAAEGNVVTAVKQMDNKKTEAMADITQDSKQNEQQKQVQGRAANVEQQSSKLAASPPNKPGSTDQKALKHDDAQDEQAASQDQEMKDEEELLAGEKEKDKQSAAAESQGQQEAARASGSNAAPQASIDSQPPNNQTQ